MTRIDFHNSTDLPGDTLLDLFKEGVAGWALRPLTIRVRYSRGADFSGTCFYTERRIYINIGRHLAYPYLMGTNLALTKTIGRRWYKPIYTLEMGSGYEVAAFVFMHELYHLLVKRARRNTRQKESMCDRFAARFVVTLFGATVRDEKGQVIPREEWDSQDVDGFVAAARDLRAARRPIRRKRKGVEPVGRPEGQPDNSEETRPDIEQQAGGGKSSDDGQLLLFDL